MGRIVDMTELSPGVFAVGWLGTAVPTSGAVPGWLGDVLYWYFVHHHVEDDALGYHVCPRCERVGSHGEVHIEVLGRVYVVPPLIVHDVETHDYRPPARFVADIETLWPESRRKSVRGLERKDKRPALWTLPRDNKTWWDADDW